MRVRQSTVVARVKLNRPWRHTPGPFLHRGNPADDQREDHPRPARILPLQGRGHPARQDGRLRVQGVHLRDAVPQTPLRRVRPQARATARTGLRPSRGPARAAGRSAGGQDLLRRHLLRAGARPLARAVDGRERRAGPGAQGSEARHRQHAQQGHRGGGGRERQARRRAQEQHRLQRRPGADPDPGSAVEGPARPLQPAALRPRQRQLRVPGPARGGLRVPDQVLRGQRGQEGRRVLHARGSGAPAGAAHPARGRQHDLRPHRRFRRLPDPGAPLRRSRARTRTIWRSTGRIPTAPPGRSAT